MQDYSAKGYVFNVMETTKGMEGIEMATEKLNQAVEKASMLETEVMLQFDTMAQLQKEERMELEKLFATERAETREAHAKEKESMRKHYQRIILAISLVLLLIVGSLIGGTIYLLSNYDIGFQTYQEVNTEGGGNSTIEDGIRVNREPTDSDLNE